MRVHANSEQDFSETHLYLSSKKLLSLGFKPNFNIEDAISEIIDCYKNGFLDNIENMSNINWIKKNQFE